MIIINNAKPTKEGKKRFYVTHTGENGEPLNTSELLTSKQKCFVNILSDLLTNYKGCTGVWVIDTTGKTETKKYYTIDELKKKAGKK